MNLATEYRPSKFSEVVGQTLPVKALKRIAEAEGISARSILMQGSYGSGKCQSGDTVVVTTEGIRRMKDIFKGIRLNPGDQVETSLEIFVNNKSEKLSNLYYSGVQKTKKFKMHDGREFECSLHHPYYVWNPIIAQFEYKEAKDIEEGDMFCVDLTETIFKESEYVKTGIDYYKIHPKSKLGVNFPEYVDEDLAYFIGILEGDGYAGQGLNFISSDDELLNFAEGLMGKYGKVSIGWDSRREHLGRVRFNRGEGKGLLMFLKNEGIIGTRSETKKVPNCIWESPFSCQLAFVRGLMDTDGSCSKGEFGLDLNSKDLTDFVMHLANSMGIHSWYIKKRGKSNRLRFDRTNSKLKEFLTLSRKLEAVEILEFPGQNKFQMEYLGLSLLYKEFNKVPKKIRKLINLSNIITVGVFPSTLLKYREIQESLGYFPNTNIPVGSNLSKVISIEDGEADLYDLTNPESSSYRANGVISHNTTLSRIFAKAMNCENFKKLGDVCNECPGCKEVMAKNSNLYYEFDSSVVGKVENIRNLESLFSVIPNGRRVITIDECHAASVAAQTALLKPIEEGVPNTIFVFATTDNVINTIRSRSVYLEIVPIPLPLVKARVYEVAKSRGVEITDAQLDILAQKSAGHMRDALSIFQLFEICGEDAISTAYFTVKDFIFSAFSKSRTDQNQVLEQLLRYPIKDIWTSISVFIKSLYLAEPGSKEEMLLKGGVAFTIFNFFYSPVAQQAVKDEIGIEILLRAFLEKVKSGK